MVMEFYAQLVVLFTAVAVAVALILCGLMRHKSQKSPSGKWLIASNATLMIIAFAVFLTPFFGGRPGSLVVVAGAYVGLSFGYFAILSALEQRLPLMTVVLIGAMGLVIHQITVFFNSGPEVMLVSTSILSTVLTVYIMVTIWQAGHPYGQRMALLMCIPFGIVLMAFAGRITVLMLWDDIPAEIVAIVIIVAGMAWAAVVLELAMITLSELQARIQMRLALAQAEEADAVRTRFLLAISHELRTPMNAILGLSEVMRNELVGPLPSAYHEGAHKIHASGTQLMDLISDLLEHAESSADDDLLLRPEQIAAAIEERLNENELLKNRVA